MRWSYSRYSTYKKCPAKFKYKYLDGLQEPKTFATNRGSELHLAIELYLRNEVDKLPDELGFYQGFFDTLKHQNVMPELKLELNKDWQPVKDGEDAWFICILDAVVIFPDHAIKYDWKSGKIYDDHAVQRELYSLGLFCSYPSVNTVQGIHTYLDSKENRMTTYSRDQLPYLKEKWNAEAALLTCGDYAPRPSYSCRWCGFSKAKGGPCQF